MTTPRPTPLPPTDRQEAARRRNSREFPAIPASQYKTEIARMMWRWINKKEAEEDTYYQGLPRHAAKIGISDDQMQRLISGATKQPSRQVCRLIAEYFGIDDEKVLRMVGYETYGSLREAAAIVLPERDDLIRDLAYTTTHQWQTSYSADKAKADRLLQGAAPIETKIVLIADAVRSWFARLSTREQTQVRTQLAHASAILEATG